LQWFTLYPLVRTKRQACTCRASSKNRQPFQRTVAHSDFQCLQLQTNPINSKRFAFSRPSYALSTLCATALLVVFSYPRLHIMAKSKVLVISGPMDAKHVGGVNVMGGKQPSILDSYFPIRKVEPDELPSHTFAATGKIEIPRRSDTISEAILRPSLSLRKSISKMRRSSVSHLPELHRATTPPNKTNTKLERSDSVVTRTSPRPLRMQSSLSRLRQKVGLDRDVHVSPPASNRSTPEPETTPRSIQKDYPALRLRQSFSRDASYSSRAPSPPRPATSATIHRQPSIISQKATIINRRPPPPTAYHSTSAFPSTTPIRKPMIAPTSTTSATKLTIAPTSSTPARKPPSRPKRADSGTAIAFDEIPTQERPLPFQEIMAVQSLAERMAMYQRTREYWAYADHGLIEWTGRASGPKRAQVGI
jgi:hypothetical protein